jgi:copper homeostasis protein
MKGVEVCVFSVDDAYAAEAAGAARLELCRDYDKGGITPPWEDLQRMSPQSASDDAQLRGLRIPAVVMVRERGGDFDYSKKEKKWMMDAIKRIAKLGYQGVVFGALEKKSGRWILDRVFCKICCDIAHSLGMEAVLHRAFDEISTPFNAIDEAEACGFDRVLTGWGSMKMETLKMLKWHAQKIDILPGGGIRPENVFHYRDLGFQEIHTSSRNTEGALDIEQLKMMVDAMKGVPL